MKSSQYEPNITLIVGQCTDTCLHFCNSYPETEPLPCRHITEQTLQYEINSNSYSYYVYFNPGLPIVSKSVSPGS